MKSEAQIDSYFPAGSGARCGCYIKNYEELKLKNPMPMVPLKHLDYELEIANSLVNTTLSQQYYNPSDKFLEVDFSFPINPQAAIYKFWAEFDGTRIQGIVKQKEEAKEEFEKAKKEGRRAALGSIDPNSKDVMNLQIGNIPPKTEFTLCISFMQEMTLSMNTFYRTQIPCTIFPRYASNFIDMLEKDKKNLPKARGNFTWSFKVHLRAQRKIKFYSSPSHELSLLSQNQTGTELLLVMNEASKPNKDFIFLYTTENFQMPSYVLGTTDLSSTAMLSFIPKFCSLTIDDAYQASIADKTFQTDMNSVRGDYIFLLDRSGSMGGSRINKAKEALIIFLKSLPEDSYFNVISFGSSSNNMFSQSQKYDEKSLKKAINMITPMSADLGGTQILQPLQKILKEKVHPGYPKHLFLLTDGQVSNTSSVLRTIQKNTKYTRVHSIGIGNGASQSLIEGSAKNGKGKFIMISDYENPSNKIIELLEATLTPLISKINLKYDDHLVESIVPNPKSIPYILKNDLANFFVTFKKPITKPTQFVFEYQDTVTHHLYSTKIQIEPSSLNEPFVDKMGHLKIIKNLQKAANDEDMKIQDFMHYVKVKDYKKQAIMQSVKHQVLSEFTSFICVQKKLVDGKYQEFKAKKIQKVQIQQPRIYQDDLDDLLMCSKSLACSSASYQMSAAKSKKSSGGFFDGIKNLFSGMSMKRSSPPSQPSQPSLPSPLSQQLCMAPKMCMKQPKMEMMMCKEEMKLSMDDCLEDECEQLDADLAQFSMNKEKDMKKDIKSKPGKQNNIQLLIDCQNTNGSWTNKNIIQALSIDSSKIKIYEDKFGIDLVLTYLASEWIQKYHPQKQYALLVKKARSWLKKELENRKLPGNELEQLKQYI